MNVLHKITVSNQRLNVDISGGVILPYSTRMCVSCKFTAHIFQGILAKLSQTTVKVMRKDLFDKISYLPIKYTDTHQHGMIL